MQTHQLADDRSKPVREIIIAVGPQHRFLDPARHRTQHRVMFLFFARRCGLVEKDQITEIDQFFLSQFERVAEFFDYRPREVAFAVDHMLKKRG